MAEQYSTNTQVSHTHYRGAPENTADTLNKRRPQSTITVCYESVVRVHLLLWFTVWAGNTQMTTHTRIRTALCGLCQSQRQTYARTHNTTLAACQTYIFILSFMAQSNETLNVYTPNFWLEQRLNDSSWWKCMNLMKVLTEKSGGPLSQ